MTATLEGRAPQQAPKYSERQKAELRQLILSKLVRRIPDEGRHLTGTWREIRDKLELEQVAIRHVRSACHHLKFADREDVDRPRLSIGYGSMQDHTGHKRYVLTLI